MSVLPEILRAYAANKYCNRAVRGSVSNFLSRFYLEITMDDLTDKQLIKQLLVEAEKEAQHHWESFCEATKRVIHFRDQLVLVCDPKFVEKQRKAVHERSGEGLFKYLEFVD